MNHPRRRATLTCLAAGLLTAALPAVSAAAYPDKPIRLVVPFPPGQGADILARLIGQHLAAALGQPIVVENKVGAGGIIGTAFAAKAAPDGYTLYMGSSGPLAIGPHVYKAVGFDTLKDLRRASCPRSAIVRAPAFRVVPERMASLGGPARRGGRGLLLGA